ncbi:MAG: glycosyltransferase [Verrucomicrobiota bacterium]
MSAVIAWQRSSASTHPFKISKPNMFEPMQSVFSLSTEGLPNAICEGMACGKPIVMSDVCDARHLVEDDKNGFLCDPHSPASIANALGRMVMLTAAKKQQMGIESRKRAEHLFEPSRVLDRYETLLKSVANRASLAAHCAGLTAVSHCAVSAIE